MATITVIGDNSPAGRRKYWQRKRKQELVRELLRLESEREVFGVPIGCIKTISGNKTLQWWRDAPEGAEVFTVPPEPAYPEKLPCAVHLLPGLKLGEGVATKTLLEALARREGYNADMAAMTVEQLADQEDALNLIKAMMPAPAVPDERTAFESFVAQKFGELVDQRRAKNGDNEYMAWDMAMAWIVWQGRSAMIQPVSQGYTLNSPVIPDSCDTMQNGQPVLPDDYFSTLVNAAHPAADKAMRKYPQPNYVLLKVAEEAGEVVQAAVHYAEGRMTWQDVEGEIVQLLAMLIRLVTEGDQVNGIKPPASCSTVALAAAPDEIDIFVDQVCGNLPAGHQQ